MQKYGENYIVKVKEIISSLENKLKLFEIKYSKIHPFFKKENDKEKESNESILFDRLNHIYLLDEEKAKKLLIN